MSFVLKSAADFVNAKGKNLQARCEPYARYVDDRRNSATWPYHRALTGAVGPKIDALDDSGHLLAQCINYASQDYLGIAQDPRVHQAAKKAIDAYGVHSSGSPILLGRHKPMMELEDRLCGLFNRERCVLYPSGWAAGFGVIAGLVRPKDVIVIDQLAHNSLFAGSAISNNVHRFRHNDLEHIEELLLMAQRNHPDSGVFVIIESLYSMDADGPDLRALIRTAHQYDAIVIIDVAHDFGALGEKGLGLLETVDYAEEPDVIMGSFSKTFASNGGFVMCTREVYEYLGTYSHPRIFSNAFSPVQAAAVLAAMDIVFSPKGDVLRSRLMDNILALRQSMEQYGIRVSGNPSPIVPAFVGDETLARVTSGLLTQRGLLANLVEYPAVPVGTARFRFQVMPTHSTEDAKAAASILFAAMNDATDLIEGLIPAPQMAI